MQVSASTPRALDSIDRGLVLATQGGLALEPRPFDHLAAELGIPVGEVIERMRRMLARGVIRRIAAVPNHYALGYRHNGMSVWDVDDESISECGREVGALPFVSHCYHRPRRPPAWPYNLFAMVHGRTRTAVETEVATIAEILGPHARVHDVLYSTRILKKTGLRLTRGG
ncbi:MAG: Lrp/AsnC family transcriptional regulator [Gammaproteobacteria bacterium]|nr:Lrp/AsnC family transcriptional regulator [Gammaproteobacteria bacterium]